MSKDKAITEADQAKAGRVIASLGYGVARLPSLPDDVQKQLAGLCDDAGTIKAGGQTILDKYFDAQKAAVDKAKGDEK